MATYEDDASDGRSRRTLTDRAAQLCRSLNHIAQRRLGARLVRASDWPPLTPLERSLRDVLHRSSSDLIVDVGAHEGGFGGAVRERLCVVTPIVSIEPDPVSVVALRDRARRSGNWTVVNAAAGVETGIVNLNRFRESQFNSILAPSTEGLNYSSLLNEDSTTVEVKVVTIGDAVAAHHPLANRIFLKLDTQGFDVQLLRWLLKSTFRDRVVGLLVEVPWLRLYEGSPSFQEMISMLEGLDMTLVGLYPIHQHPQTLEVVEFDMLAIRSER